MMQLILQEFKKGINIIAIILLIILLILPLYDHVHHMGLYYIIIILGLVPFTFYRIIKSDFLEDKFYSKWKKRRKKGRLINILIEGLRTVFLIVILLLGSQFIANNNTPSFILAELPNNAVMCLASIILIFGVICGIVSWYENEKRYEKIHLNREYEEKNA